MGFVILGLKIYTPGIAYTVQHGPEATCWEL